MKKSVLALTLASTFIPSLSHAASALAFTKEWTYQHEIASEILSYDAVTNNIWVTGDR